MLILFINIFAEILKRDLTLFDGSQEIILPANSFLHLQSSAQNSYALIKKKNHINRYLIKDDLLAKNYFRLKRSPVALFFAMIEHGKSDYQNILQMTDYFKFKRQDISPRVAIFTLALPLQKSFSLILSKVNKNFVAFISEYNLPLERYYSASIENDQLQLKKDMMTFTWIKGIPTLPLILSRHNKKYVGLNLLRVKDNIDQRSIQEFVQFILQQDSKKKD